MVNDFTRWQESTALASKAWNSEKVNSEKKHTIMGSIEIWKSMHKGCLSAKKRMNEQIEDVRNTFAKPLADEKITALRSEFDQLVKANAAKYCDHVNSVCDEKVTEVDTFISRTGDPDLIALISNLNIRSEVSDREWQSIVTRVNASHDYQAAKLLAEVAAKFNRSFSVPFDPDRRIEEIEESRKELLALAKSLDKDDSDFTLTEMHIVGEHRTGYHEIYERLDTAVGVAVPKKDATLIDRLKEARDFAWNNGDNDIGNKINRFIYERATYIDNRQTVAAFYKDEAEALIKKALNPDKDNSKSFDALVNYFTPNQG